MQKISKIKDKSAGNLARKGILINDDYHNAIADAAMVLCSYQADIGENLSHLVYRTQWMSGTTLWEEPNGNGTATVDKDGVVDLRNITFNTSYEGRRKSV